MSTDTDPGVTNPCPGCHKETLYDPNFDSFYCTDCNIWAEIPCEGTHCDFCINRPKTPNERKNP